MSREKFKIEDFDPAYCELATPWLVFVGLYYATEGDPCRTGCACFNGGKCPGYLMLARDNVDPKKKKRMRTNADIADELHCSKRQVAKMRKAGLIDE